MVPDPVGDVLREYYAAFGVKDEGPPADMNVSGLCLDADLTEDITLLRRLSRDSRAVRAYIQCRDILAGIIRTLGSSTDLIKEIESHGGLEKHDYDPILSGLIWNALACSLDPRSGDVHAPVLKNRHMPPMWELAVKRQGALVFSLYTTLVYLRENRGIRALRRARAAKQPASTLCLKLFECDYVRHLRNALAHGSLGTTIAGLHFRDDEKFESVATPGFLDGLVVWTTLINTQIASVLERRLTPLYGLPRKCKLDRVDEGQTATLYPAVLGEGFHPGHAGNRSLRPHSVIGPVVRPSG